MKGFGLIVFVDWYYVDIMVKMKFFDDNIWSWWIFVMGGVNILVLNDLFVFYGIVFGDIILNGVYFIGGERVYYVLGIDFLCFFIGGFVYWFFF